MGVAALSLFAWSQAPVTADTPLFTTVFTPAEFTARRTKVMAEMITWLDKYVKNAKPR